MSARQLWDRGIVELVRRALDDIELPADALELEITESSIMRDVEVVLPLLHELKDLGIPLSIDDFGTGYSNLNYLRQLPVDRVKMDRSLIHEVATSRSAAAIARGVIDLSHALGFKVVAEGVESVEQVRFLLTAGCDEVQGFFIARPLPADEAGQLLASPVVIDQIGALSQPRSARPS